MNVKKFVLGISAKTGDLLSQPNADQLTPGSCGCFTADFREYISLLGSLDAPDVMPSGGVRLFDGSELAIGWCHVWRDGALDRSAV